jgi:hypothetical protein
MDLYSEPEARVAEREVVVYTAPSPTASERGRIEALSAFWVLGPADGPDCAEGWAQLEAGGYACLDGTLLTEERPSARPVRLLFDLPQPSEFEPYLRTGAYDRGEPEPLLPSLWGRRWRRFRGQLYESLEAWEAGERPVGRVSRRPERFVGSLQDGAWLVREDGRVARLQDVYLSPSSRLQGRDLVIEPPPDGTWPALAAAYDGIAVRSAPDPQAPVVGWWPYHTWLFLEPAPASADGRWWEVPEVGYVLEGERGVRHPLPPGPVPDGVGAQELWVEVLRGQQALCVYQGESLVYFTAVSTSSALRALQGEHRLLGKQVSTALPAVGEAPWSLPLSPTCALHGAWWHWGFGHRASEGCAHLSPRDAAWLFRALSPALPDGWSSITALPGEGTVVRVRE